jgi:4-amino-4-deoxy-L-arabinose transferase-like glycosyltransferase
MKKNIFYSLGLFVIFIIVTYIFYLNVDKNPIFLLLFLPVCFSIVLFFVLFQKFYQFPRMTLLTLILIEGILSFIFVRIAYIPPIHDSTLYAYLASSLAQGNLPPDFFVATFPHTIGYPAVLAVLYRIFGINIYVGYSLNIFLGMLNVYLIFLLAKKSFNEKTGLTAAFIAAFTPSFIFYTPNLCTEIIFTTLFLTSAIGFLHFIEIENKYARIVLLGILGIWLGLINAVRPYANILLAAFVIYYFFFNVYTKKRIQIIGFTLVGFLLMGFLFLGTKSVINDTISRTVSFPIATKHAGGFSFFLGVNDKFSGYYNTEDPAVYDAVKAVPGRSAEQTQEILFNMAIERIKNNPNFIDFLHRKNYIMWADDHIGVSLYNDGLVLQSTQSGNPLPEISKAIPYMRKACDLYYFTIIVFCIVGILFLFREQFNRSIIYLMCFAAVFVGHQLVEADSRYHHFVTPFLIIVAAFGIMKLIELWDKRSGSINL